jgi:hypothetical protein
MLPALCAMLFKTYPQSLLLPSRNRLSCALANKNALTSCEVRAFDGQLLSIEPYFAASSSGILIL